jgi:hypothetical protein
MQAGSESLIQKLGLKADPWKGYVEFELCHSLPSITGPVQEGNYIGYTAETLAMSHASLEHQQMNLRHLLKSYAPKTIARDRIIGCVVATAFPRKPNGGWPKVSAAGGGKTPAVRGVAAIFKLAEGVSDLIGKHVASRQKQSVSIETITSFNNIGLWVASQPDVVVPLLEPGAMEECITEGDNGQPLVGRYKGEQVVMLYGTGKPVHFRGVGMTPNPAERSAKVLGIAAERQRMEMREMDGEQVMAIAAERHDALIGVGQRIKFRTGRTGIVRQVFTDGMARHQCIKIAASAESPVAKVEIVDGLRPSRQFVLRRLLDLVEGSTVPRAGLHGGARRFR